MAIKRQSLGVKKTVSKKYKTTLNSKDMGNANDRMARRMGGTGAVQPIHINIVKNI